MLKLLDIHKSFDTEATTIEVLRGVSFEMVRGQNLAIIGPSGSGKSTLLHLIGTLEAPSSGSITFEGRSPFNLADPELARFRNETIGFVFQDHHLLPQYSVLENVLIPTLAFKRLDPKIDWRARELLERVGLSHRLDHRPAELSGGERQRVAVARALINQPAILLCDEPTGNLDHATAENVASLLFELHQAEKTLMIAVTHSLELAGKFEQRFELKEGECSAA